MLTPYSNIISVTTLAFDTDYQAVLNYATSQSYTLPSASQQILQNQLVLDLKAGGIWSKLDTFAIFATDGSSDFALIDWKRLSLYTAFNSPTFTANEGFQGNGTSSYIDMNYTTNTNWVNVSQNNVCLFTNNLINTTLSLVVGSATTYLQMTFRNASNNISTRFHSTTLGTITSLGAVGRLYNTRNNSSNYDIYFNGNFEGTASTTTSLVTTSLFLFRQASTYFSTQTSYVGYGAYLDATEIGNLDNYLNTYLTSL